jgi:hypothetical protein
MDRRHHDRRAAPDTVLGVLEDADWTEAAVGIGEPVPPDAEHRLPPTCQRCEGTGRLEVYEQSGYGRRLGTIPCDGPHCMDGVIEEPECEACLAVLDGATAHYCWLDSDTVWALCDGCAKDAELHLGRCAP